MLLLVVREGGYFFIDSSPVHAAVKIWGKYLRSNNVQNESFNLKTGGGGK